MCVCSVLLGMREHGAPIGAQTSTSVAHTCHTEAETGHSVACAVPSGGQVGVCGLSVGSTGASATAPHIDPPTADSENIPPSYGPTYPPAYGAADPPARAAYGATYPPALGGGNRGASCPAAPSNIADVPRASVPTKEARARRSPCVSYTGWHYMVCTVGVCDMCVTLALLSHLDWHRLLDAFSMQPYTLSFTELFFFALFRAALLFGTFIFLSLSFSFHFQHSSGNSLSNSYQVTYFYSAGIENFRPYWNIEYFEPITWFQLSGYAPHGLKNV